MRKKLYLTALIFAGFFVVFLGLLMLSRAPKPVEQEPVNFIQGRKVITELDVDLLENGRKYEFYFQTIANNIGQYWHVPVTVIKGSKLGKKILIITGIHGDEANGMGATILVKQALDAKKLEGTVTIVHAANITGLLNNRRGYKHTGNTGGSTVDMNKLFADRKPEAGLPYPEVVYTYTLWNNLLKNNADFVIDLHTAYTGTHGPLVMHVDQNKTNFIDLINYFDTDLVMLEDVKPKTLIATFASLDVPGVSLDLGASERYQHDMVMRAADGILNYLKHLAVLPGEATFYPRPKIVNSVDTIRAKIGGYTVATVGANKTVAAGDLVAYQYDSFGKRVDYFAPRGGVVTGIRHFPVNEVGTILLQIVYYDPQHKTQVLNN